MPSNDIRWIQRFNNFTKAFSLLTGAVELSRQREPSNLEKLGFMRIFENTHELAWKTIRDFFEDQGDTNINGSRDVTRLAFKRGLIENGQIWMDMIKSRNDIAHAYDEAVADVIVTDIINTYFTEFEWLYARLTRLKAEEACR